MACLSLVTMGKAERMLIGMNNLADYLIDSDVVLHLGKYVRPAAAHIFSVAFHYREVCADRGSEVGFVDDEQVGLSDTGAAFARNFVTA